MIYVVLLLLVVLLVINVFQNDIFDTQRARRHKLAGKLGLHNNPSVAELHLSNASKDELVGLIEGCDTETFKKVSRSNHFYLVESRNSMLSMYCSIEDPINAVTYKDLQTDRFLRIRIQDFVLERFLRDLIKR